jgi:hypothetical protein
MLRRFLIALRGCQDASCTQGRAKCTEHCLDEMACTAGSEPTVPQLQMHAPAELPADVCRAGWVWVREYVHDLREDYANRVGAP